MTALLSSGQLVTLHHRVLGNVRDSTDADSGERQTDGDWELL